MEEVQIYNVVKSKTPVKNQITLKHRMAKEGEPFTVDMLLGEQDQLDALLSEDPCRIRVANIPKLAPLSGDAKERQEARKKNAKGKKNA
jgi:hypothetical protein